MYVCIHTTRQALEFYFFFHRDNIMSEMKQWDLAYYYRIAETRARSEMLTTIVQRTIRIKFSRRFLYWNTTRAERRCRVPGIRGIVAGRGTSEWWFEGRGRGVALIDL